MRSIGRSQLAQPSVHLVLFLLRRKLASWTTFDIVGPLNEADAENRPLIEGIASFRREQNLRRVPYLETEAQHRLEARLGLDARSFHFAACADERIVASVRLTPAPFELSVLLPDLDVGAYASYLEFSRLCVAEHLPRPLRLEAISQMVTSAGVWCLAHPEYGGIVALCRADRIAFMRKVGLRCKNRNLAIPDRGEDYALMAGSRRELLNYQRLIFRRR
jgi:hypothetical protein